MGSSGLLVVTSIALIGGLVWLLISVLRALFPRWRASAWLGIKRSVALMVVSLLGSVWLNQSSERLPPAPSTVSTDATETTIAADEDEGPTLELSATPPIPTARPEFTPVKAATEPERLSSSQEFVWIRANQRLIVQKLRDPDSARFANDYVSYKSGGPIVCGTVNAKNGFGGYGGAERYIGGGTAVGVYLASEVSGFNALWNKLC